MNLELDNSPEAKAGRIFGRILAELMFYGILGTVSYSLLSKIIKIAVTHEVMKNLSGKRSNPVDPYEDDNYY